MKLTILASFVAGVAAVQRFTFESSGTQIVGYHWAPECQEGRSRFFPVQKPAPVIVMAHGLAALQTSKLQPYAERFAAEGYHAITFDYRHWGQSEGTPRNIVDLDLQQDDYRAAVRAVKKLKGVDAKKIIIWGSSLSGGTVLQLGAYFYNNTDYGVAGVISQVPHTNGPATAALTPQDTLPNLINLSVADKARINTTESPIYVPVANYTGELGLLTQAGAEAGYLSIQPNPPGPEYSNIAARFIITLPFFNPDATAFESHFPTYIGIGLDDNIVSPTGACNLAAKMPNATTYKYPGVGHFDVYPGASAYKENLDNQVAFLKKYFPVQRWRW